MSPNGKSEKTLADFGEIAGKTVTLTTTKGPVVIELYREEAPLTTANFLSLVNTGFYDGIVFHRVIADFMAQVGDPLTKDPNQQAMWGTGGPGYIIADEFAPGLSHNSPGVVSMANSGPNTGGSQFFITYGPTEWLDGKHAIFGKVTQGMDVVEQITVGDLIVSIQVE
ncbi:MAG: peptidylprolyl isomerase [Candidatus Pacebacteria bacterium]|nr:peptidylprolyl isomerase [Candidatus Paceibacterota bacterium]PIR60547.1 MAG: peptidylprolyl isomerase [Candidatus Pacebacteria bacterium CG10_big_fil_rev_8_21_14_0_10_44_54]